ncbi:hypothetical protein BH24ACI2_BH24ACI2_16130 [soil metagenome]
MVKATDIAWLSGIIDGEGCVYARQISIRSLTFRITIETVSETMIDKVREIYTQCEVEYRIEPPIWRSNSTRFAHRLKVDKKQAVHKLCNLILPYSVVKKPELVLIKLYLDKAIGTYYSATEEDLKILTELKELKRIA